MGTPVKGDSDVDYRGASLGVRIMKSVTGHVNFKVFESHSTRGGVDTWIIESGA